MVLCFINYKSMGILSCFAGYIGYFRVLYLLWIP